MYQRARPHWFDGKLERYDEKLAQQVNKMSHMQTPVPQLSALRECLQRGRNTASVGKIEKQQSIYEQSKGLKQRRRVRSKRRGGVREGMV